MVKLSPALTRLSSSENLWFASVALIVWLIPPV
jgi:hypothetical protein